jgi:hypothetical protein
MLNDKNFYKFNDSQTFFSHLFKKIYIYNLFIKLSSGGLVFQERIFFFFLKVRVEIGGFPESTFRVAGFVFWLKESVGEIGVHC